MKLLLCTLLGVVTFAVTASSQTWNLVWSDEFSSPTINTSNWTYDIGGNGWGNSELEYYTNRPVNATIDSGALLIIAKKETYGGNSYTSARLKSQGLRSFMYGKVEARIKLPSQQGAWPAFWMLGNSISQVGWPACGEIDIMEHIDKANWVKGTIHWDNNGHAEYGGSTTCNVTQYHTYSIQWSDSTITWFLDGAPYWQGNITNNINSTNEFHAPFFIILNLAIGGVWPGNPDSTTTFPDTMFVDYVRVYQLTTGVNDNGDGLPKHSELLQNYPNPFNPRTEISYQVPNTGDVNLDVYDIFGRQIAALVHEKKSAGSYTTQFDGTGLASGTYLCRLMANNSIHSQRMLLLR